MLKGRMRSHRRQPRTDGCNSLAGRIVLTRVIHVREKRRWPLKTLRNISESIFFIGTRAECTFAACPGASPRELGVRI
jgi:hypothetical protein